MTAHAKDDDVEGHSRVEGETGVYGIHETLFLVRLDGEDGKPNVEWGRDDKVAEEWEL